MFVIGYSEAVRQVGTRARRIIDDITVKITFSYDIQDSGLLYHLIREIKTRLDINTITYIVYFKSQRTVIENTKSYIINKQVIYVIYTHTHTALTFEQIYLFRNAIDCTVFDLGMRNCLPDGRSSCLARTRLLSSTITLAFRTTCRSYN